VTEQDFEALLALGHETNGVEFKGPGSRSDKAFLARVVRAVLGMANRRDGGHVIIGVESTTLDPVGLEDDQARTWLNYDDLAASVNEYASPSVSFDLEALTSRNRKLVIIRVHEFQDIPVLCRKDFQSSREKKAPPILRRGACYVRSRHKPETSEIPSEKEMRELLELAIDKGVRRFVTRVRNAGLFPPVGPPPVSSGDVESFEDQIEDIG
jgi:predicted HTH transcriptional regulator